VPERGKLLAYLGGIRSGKSREAQLRFSAELEAVGARKPVYLGTLLPPHGEDPESHLRIATHRQARPAHWETRAVDRDLAGAAAACLAAGQDAWLLDGLGAWAAHFLDKPKAALEQWRGFLPLARQAKLCVAVLDEVGQGGVSGQVAARLFADINGELNQAVCGAADEAYAVQAGLLLRLK
jgi:adenosylcobinamide kinase/adenosylcobinamide-phosphate guanylyltransferase